MRSSLRTACLTFDNVGIHERKTCRSGLVILFKANRAVGAALSPRRCLKKLGVKNAIADFDHATALRLRFIFQNISGLTF
jgi:hypothetical protein